MVMKQRMMPGWVTVAGPPLAICSLNFGEFVAATLAAYRS
jgi:hypothetical protein